MSGADWETVTESELRRFLRGAQPGWRASEVAAAESKLRRVGIDGPEMLVAALVPQQFDPDRLVLTDMFELEDLVPFTSETTDALLQQSERPLPKARLVTQPRERGRQAPEAKPLPPRLSRFFEGEEEEEEKREAPSWAEQKRQHLERKAQFETAATLREKKLEGCRRRGQEIARAEFESTWRAPELQEEDETFEVVHSMAVIKEAPHESAPDIGVVRRGEFIQVRSRRAEDSSGHAWVELTQLELLRSCSPGQGTVTAGFVLIDGRHLNLPLLLRGPVHRAGDEPEPAPEAAAAEACEEATQEEPAPAEVEAAAAAVQPARAPEPVEAAPARAPPRRKLGQGRTQKLTAQTFRVVHAKGASVKEGPAEQELEISLEAKGAMLELEEETFDGWARLAGSEGWVRRRGCTAEGLLEEFLSPVGKAPLLACPELAGPGPRQFEVVFRPRVAVKLAPRPTAKLLGNKSFGEFVLAASQTYDGWVRLAGSEGWVLGIGQESGQMLR